MKKIRIHLGAFDFSLWVIVTPDWKAALRFARFKFEDETVSEHNHPAVADGYAARGRTLYRPGYVPIIWLPAVPKTAREISTLAHEALHVTAIVMRWAAIPFSEDSEEAYAHTQAAIVAEALERLRG